jgi:capsule biosynthesis phosphatase
MDLDETISSKGPRTGYEDASPRRDVIEKMRAFREQGFTICIFTARNMRTYDGNIGKINAHTLPVILAWLAKHDVPYDEVIVGKPWCGHEGFYVDDRAIRPSEFVALSPPEIDALLAQG